MSRLTVIALVAISLVGHAAATNHTNSTCIYTETSAEDCPSSSCMTAGGIFAKVIGQSGKIDLAPGSDIGANDDRIRIEISALRQLDSDGETIGQGGSAKHSFNSFATQDFEFGQIMDDEYEGLSVVKVPFSSTLKTGSHIDIMLYIFKESGDIMVGDEEVSVSCGTFKFNVELSDWAWCGDDGVKCKVGQTEYIGTSLELDISVTSQADVELIEGTNMYDLGGSTMDLSNKIKLDDGDWEAMPNSGPDVVVKGKTMTFTLYFPKFYDSAVYDPTVEFDSAVGGGGGGGGGVDSKAKVTMVVQLPYDKAGFMAIENKFKSAVARVAETTSDKVTVNSVTEKQVRRRVLLGTAVDVSFSVETENEETGADLAGKLSLASLNAALRSEGLDEITDIVDAPVVQSTVPTVDDAGWTLQVATMSVLVGAACMQLLAH